MKAFENIAGCMLAVGLALRMLPDKKYEQYVRLFTGFLLILLLLQPFFRIGSADELLEKKIVQFAGEQEELERKIFAEGKTFLPEKQEKREIVIESIQVEVTGQ